MAASKPTLAVWKFSSCDGCQLSLLDCEDELLALADRIHIAYFLEASSATVEGPYDVSIVEGSITTAHDAERIHEVRRSSRALITIGACATAGGIQALRNFASVEAFTSIVYASPDYISTLRSSTPISDHVPVDFELHGCPIDKRQLLEVISAHLSRRRPRVRAHSVCIECKRRGTVCVMVAHGTPCLGPVTHAGCGALCPSYDRGCYGCFGPQESPNTAALSRRMSELGSGEVDLVRIYRTFNADSDAFRRASEAHEATRPARPARPTRPTRPARPMSAARPRARPDERRTPHPDDPHRLPGPRRGRGSDVRQARRRAGLGRQAAHLRAATLLRGDAARTRLRGGGRHHRPDLRHLPGRLPDERGAGDGGCLRRDDRRGPDPRPAAAALLRRVDREPQPARLHRCMRPTSSATRGRSRCRATTGRWWSAGCR